MYGFELVGGSYQLRTHRLCIPPGTRAKDIFCHGLYRTINLQQLPTPNPAPSTFLLFDMSKKSEEDLHGKAISHLNK